MLVQRSCDEKGSSQKCSGILRAIGVQRGSKISASGCTDGTAPASATSGIGKLIDMRRVESGDGDHLCRTVRAGNGK